MSASPRRAFSIRLMVASGADDRSERYTSWRSKTKPRQMKGTCEGVPGIGVPGAGVPGALGAIGTGRICEK